MVRSIGSSTGSGSSLSYEAAMVEVEGKVESMTEAVPVGLWKRGDWRCCCRWCARWAGGLGRVGGRRSEEKEVLHFHRMASSYALGSCIG